MDNKKYINLIKEFSIVEFKIKDQRSVLGFLWSFLNPLIMTTILFFLFKSRISTEPGLSYFVYILIGVVIWNFFSGGSDWGLAALVDNSNFVKDGVFPKEILPLSRIGAFIIQHFFEMLAIFVIIALTGVKFSAHIILLPVIILMEIFLVAGISLFLSCFYVHIRDFKYIWNVITRMGFFLVPVFYTSSNISAEFRWIVAINPLSQIMIFSRDILLYHRLPSLLNFVLVFLFSLLTLMAGYKFFKHHEYHIIEKV